MYSNSATTGDWETYVAVDLIAYVDSHYRTIPNRISRGLAGHSMGGCGAVRIGMKRPDVFSSLYVMSSCCLNATLTFDAERAGARGSDQDPRSGRGSRARPRVRAVG